MTLNIRDFKIREFQTVPATKRPRSEAGGTTLASDTIILRSKTGEKKKNWHEMTVDVVRELELPERTSRQPLIRVYVEMKYERWRAHSRLDLGLIQGPFPLTTETASLRRKSAVESIDAWNLRTSLRRYVTPSAHPLGSPSSTLGSARTSGLGSVGSNS